MTMAWTELRMARVGLWVLLTASTLSGCAAARHCTAIGCVNGARLEGVTVEAERLLGATVRVCRNERCSEAVVEALPDRPGVGVGLPLGGDLRTSVVLRPEGGAVAVEVEVTGEEAYPYGLVDGDVYRLELDDPSGAALVRHEWVATYQESYPNGPDCDPFPCRQASLSAP